MSRAQIEQAVRDTGLATDVAVIEIATLGGSRCLRCGISAAVPGLRFDEEGVCSECRRYDRYRERLDLYFRDQPALDRIFADNRPKKRSEIDCLLLFSGGKDSTYVLHQLVNMGLKVVTFTFDNGFISPKAFENIHRVTDQLGVEHHTATHDRMNEVFRESLARHQTVCKGCFKALLDLSLAYADRRGINVVLNGLSRGQIIEERLKFFYDRNVFDPATIDEKLAEGRRVYHQAERYPGLDGHEFAEGSVFDRVQQIDYFRYSAATKSEIYAYLRNSNQGWEEPTDTGFCSSNCLVNDVGIAVHSAAHGYSNYEVPTAWEVRVGHLDREAALAELTGDPAKDRVDDILGDLRLPPITERETGPIYEVHCVTASPDGVRAIERSVRQALGPTTGMPMRFLRAAHIERLPNGAVRPVSALAAKPSSSQVSKTTAEPPIGKLHLDLLAVAESEAGWTVKVVETPDPLDQDAMRRALLHLLAGQPRLRLTVSPDGSPSTAPVSAKLPLRWIDMSAMPAGERGRAVGKLPQVLVGKARGAESGLLHVAVATPDARNGATICIVGAHALMDEASWHRLAGALERSYRAVAEGRLPPVQRGAGDGPQEIRDAASFDIDRSSRSIGPVGCRDLPQPPAAVLDDLGHAFGRGLSVFHSRASGSDLAFGHFTQFENGSEVAAVMAAGGPAHWAVAMTAQVLSPSRSWVVVAPRDTGTRLWYSDDPASETDARLRQALDAAFIQAIPS
jgi:Queuosine biosynthesis protein QueC